MCIHAVHTYVHVCMYIYTVYVYVWCVCGAVYSEVISAISYICRCVCIIRMYVHMAVTYNMYNIRTVYMFVC